MKSFNYKNPTEIIFGEGRIKEVGERLKPLAKKVLLTYGGGSIKQNGVYDTVVQSLKENGVEFVEFCGIKPNPVLSHAREGVKVAVENGVDAVLAVGGGSVVDESKAIALGACYDGDVWDFFCGKAIPKESLKVFTILTVPATGSEMNGGAVITNEECHAKFASVSPLSYPVFSILDPATTLSLPVAYVKIAAVDIFTHSIEAYFVKEDTASFVMDRAVEGVVKSLIEATDKVIEDPNDVDARANFMWTATLGWNGSLHCGVGAFGVSNHVIEHPLSAVFDIAHGAGLAIVVPSWMKVFEEKHAKRFALLGRNVFGVVEADDLKASVKTREAVTAWFKRLDMPTNLSEAGILAVDVEKLSDLVMQVMLARGAQIMTRDEVKKVLEIAVR